MENEEKVVMPTDESTEDEAVETATETEVTESETNEDETVTDFDVEEDEDDDEEIEINFEDDDEDVSDDDEEDDDVDLTDDNEEENTEDESETDEEEGSTETESAAEETQKTESETKTQSEDRKRYDDLEWQAKETLKRLGYATDGESALEGLQKVAAEAADMSIEEYKKKVEDDRIKAEAENLVKQKAFAELKAKDLAELKKEFSHLSSVNDLEKINNFQLFASFRDKGLTPKQAYSAANPDEGRQRAESYNKAKARNDSKAHLRSSVPVGAKDNSVRMTKSELEFWRSAFPHNSDKEIARIYANIKNKTKQ